MFDFRDCTHLSVKSNIVINGDHQIRLNFINQCGKMVNSSKVVLNKFLIFRIWSGLYPEYKLDQPVVQFREPLEPDSRLSEHFQYRIPKYQLVDAQPSLSVNGLKHNCNCTDILIEKPITVDEDGIFGRFELICFDNRSRVEIGVLVRH